LTSEENFILFKHRSIFLQIEKKLPQEMRFKAKIISLFLSSPNLKSYPFLSFIYYNCHQNLISPIVFLPLDNSLSHSFISLDCIVLMAIQHGVFETITAAKSEQTEV
jgi:hypothetical protein